MRTAFHTRLFFLVSFTALLSVSSAFAATPPMAIPINFHGVVQNSIYRGARPQSAASLNYLKSIGIKTVIDLQGGDLNNFLIGSVIPLVESGETATDIAAEKKAVLDRQMAFYNFPLNSLSDVSNQDAQKIEQILKIMADPAQQPVYVHCAHGADRTGLVIALYRVKYQNWSRTAAYEEMIQNGHNLVHMLATFGMDEYLFMEGLSGYFQKYFDSYLESLNQTLALMP